MSGPRNVEDGYVETVLMSCGYWYLSMLYVNRNDEKVVARVASASRGCRCTKSTTNLRQDQNLRREYPQREAPHLLRSLRLMQIRHTTQTGSCASLEEADTGVAATFSRLPSSLAAVSPEAWTSVIEDPGVRLPAPGPALRE